MKCRRVPLEAEVEKYELGKDLEDGFERWVSIVTTVGINTEELIKITKEDGTVVCPYVEHRRGRTYIREDDYIILDADGTKHVCGANKVFQRYEKIDE